MEKRYYADFFTVPQDYKANMTREAINETPETWLDFYPHTKYVEFLNTLIQAINGGSKSIWLTGSYGTGKSNAALVTQKLFMDDEGRVRKWFEDCKDKLADPAALLNNLLARRREGTLVVYDYDASGVGPNEDFLVRLERGIVAALHENSMAVPAKANLDEIVQRVCREDKHFFEIRDAMQGELAYLNSGIKTVERLMAELQKAHQHTDAPADLLGDVQKVLHRDNIYLDISVDTFRKWIKKILSANNFKRIVYIFDEFSEFIDSHKEHLKTFEDVAENPGINKLYFVPVTHMQMNAYWSESGIYAKKANDRFHFRNLQMPNDTAFKLAAYAMKPNPDPAIAEEWKIEKDNLWQAVRGIAEVHFNSNDSGSSDYISKQSFIDILPIHPMAAFLLKFLSESARSNQRSIFEYLKGSADGQEFHEFIRAGGPGIARKQFLTADYLWKYFIEREDLGLSTEIVAIRNEFERIKSREFQNKDDDDEDIRVLKAALLFCLLSRLLTTELHDRLKPTVENIKLAFQGDGAVVGVDGIIKNLSGKHCFSVVNGNIELFATSVGDADLQKKIDELKPKFHDLLSSKTEEILKNRIKSDIAKFSSMGRFDFRVSDIGHTTLQYINTSTRERYGTGANNTGSVCLWFVVAKNKEEQLQAPDKISSILTQLRDHRIMMFAFPGLTFCSTNQNLWNDYVEQYAKYTLENNKTAKDQCQKAYERLEGDWFGRITGINTQIKFYTFVNGQVAANDTSWSRFKNISGDYVRRTLTCCVDYLTEQTLAFGSSGLQTWAKTGIQFDAATNPYRQLAQAFKSQGITADAGWFAQNANHPIAQIRALLDKKIAGTIGKGTSLSIRSVYTELQRAPFGMKYNALSAFVLGVALRHILDKGYQWDNGQRTGTLDVDVLAEIIDSVVKDDGQDRIKYEKQICLLSREEKAFVEKAPGMFGIVNAVANARVEDVLGQIQTRIEHISGRVPLWALPEYIHSVNEPSTDSIIEALNNVCAALIISSKGKTDDRTNAIKEIGRLIFNNANLADTIAGYIKPDNFVTAFQMYVDKTAPALITLAKEIGDVAHGYCQSILDNAAETAGWLWKESDISNEINETIQEYEIIKLLKPIVGFTTFVSYKTAFDILKNAVTTTNKLPRNLIETAEPSLSGLLSGIVDNKAASKIKEELEQNADVVKALFFDVTKEKSVKLLKQRLTGVTVSDGDLLTVYNRLPGGFSSDESVFLNDVRAKIEEFVKDSVALNIKNEWKRLTESETPSAWAAVNGIPARFALGDMSNAGDIITAAESPEKFSSGKLDEALDVMRALSPLGIKDCHNRFFAETMPRRFVKFNMSLSPLLDYLKGKYGAQPNNWPPKVDINEFIRGQYKGTFAPQVAEKIRNIPAEDIKNRLLQLAQDNPDLGLLFWE
ncbi:MAG: hypothetical protein LBF60_03270 [Treponema sp.]|jgi:hypothetical protein|nr:hypothetical protein [Treponema sp.]